jgi:hypothetical protein
MRRAITLGLYVLMIAAGAWLTYHWLVHGGRGIVFMAGIFLAGFGLYLLWIDFLSPDRKLEEAPRLSLLHFLGTTLRSKPSVRSAVLPCCLRTRCNLFFARQPRAHCARDRAKTSKHEHPLQAKISETDNEQDLGRQKSRRCAVKRAP